MKKIFLWSVLLSLLLVSAVSADVRMPKMFTSNCVLQRDAAVSVFGWADAGEKVTVEFNGQKVETTACEQGKWSVKLAPMAAKCEGSVMTITGKNVVKVENVVVGEVWVCGGQSNMQFSLGRSTATE
ncbi:MAG: 9-O-acetylesterase, partial [Planctomycetia bacterium]|nr:9-O-acetylesterase [Planctomycetia bacterium]